MTAHTKQKILAYDLYIVLHNRTLRNLGTARVGSRRAKDVFKARVGFTPEAKGPESYLSRGPRKGPRQDNGAPTSVEAALVALPRDTLAPADMRLSKHTS